MPFFFNFFQIGFCLYHFITNRRKCILNIKSKPFYASHRRSPITKFVFFPQNCFSFLRKTPQNIACQVLLKWTPNLQILNKFCAEQFLLSHATSISAHFKDLGQSLEQICARKSRINVKMYPHQISSFKTSQF